MWKSNLCLLLAGLVCSVQGSGTQEYDCYMCVLSVEHAFEHNLPTLRLACESLFGIEVCRDFDVFKNDFFIDQSSSSSSARAVCQLKTTPGTCSDLTLEAWRHSSSYRDQHAELASHEKEKKEVEEKGSGVNKSISSSSSSSSSSATVMDVRVSKAYGSRVRLKSNYLAPPACISSFLYLRDSLVTYIILHCSPF